MAVFTDAFTRTDSTNLGANWTETSGDFSISGNKCLMVTSEAIARYEQDVGSNNMYAQAKVEYTSFGGWCILARYASGAQTFYQVDGNNNSNEGIRLYKCVAGAYTQLGTNQTFGTSEATQYTYRLTVDGSTLTATVNGGSSYQQTDGTITTGQRGGIKAYSGSATLIDDFEAGALDLMTVTARGNFRTTTNQGSSATTTATSASFTPTQGNILILCAAGYVQATTLTFTPSATHSNVTWAAVTSGSSSLPNVGGYSSLVQFWVGTVGPSPGAGTVSVQRSGGTVDQWVDCTLWEVSGSSGSAAQAANNNNQVTGDLATSFGTAPAASSAVFGCGYFSQDTTITLPTGVTSDHNFASTADTVTAWYDFDASIAQTNTWTAINSAAPHLVVTIELPVTSNSVTGTAAITMDPFVTAGGSIDGSAAVVMAAFTAAGTGSVTTTYDYIIPTTIATLQALLDLPAGQLAGKKANIIAGTYTWGFAVADVRGGKDFGGLEVYANSGAVMRGTTGIEMYGGFSNISFTGFGVVEVDGTFVFGEGVQIDSTRTDKGANGGVVDNITFDGWTFRPQSGTGSIQRNGIAIWGADRVTVKNCTVDRAASNAFAGFGSAGSLISIGHSRRSSAPGSPRVIIQNNTLTNALTIQDGPSADRNGIILDLYHGDGGGLYADRAVGAILIDNNHITNVDGRGIQLLYCGMNDSPVTVSNNTVDGTWARNLGGSAPETAIGGYGGGRNEGNITCTNNVVVTDGGNGDKPAYKFISFDAGGAIGVLGSGNSGNRVEFEASPTNTPPANFLGAAVTAGSVAANMAPFTAAASGTVSTGNISGLANTVTAAFTVAAVGTVTPTSFFGSAAVTMAAFTAAASGTTTLPVASTKTPLLQGYVAFAASASTSDPVWTEIPMRSCQIRRGRSDETQRVGPGSATVVVPNADRRFDPTNTTSPYYGQLLPMRQFKLQATWGNVIYPMFRGYVEGWPQDYDPSNKDATVTLVANDATAFLQNVPVATGYPFAPSWRYKLDEKLGVTAVESVSGNSGAYVGGVTLNRPSLIGGADSAVEVNGGMVRLAAKPSDTSNWALLVTFRRSSHPEFGEIGTTFGAGYEVLFDAGQMNFTYTNQGFVSGGGLSTFSHPGAIVLIDPSGVLQIYMTGLVTGPGSDSAPLKSVVDVCDGEPHSLIIMSSSLAGATQAWLDGVSLGTLGTQTTTVGTWRATSATVGDAIPGTRPYYPSLQACTSTLIDEIVVWNQSQYVTAAAFAAQASTITTRANGYANQTASNRIGALLDVAGWPSTQRNLSSDGPILAPVASNAQMWTEAVIAEQSENGRLFVDKQGRVTLHGRFRDGKDSRATNTQVTFSDDGADVGYMANGFEFGYGMERVTNEVTVSGATAEYTARDKTSADTYGVRSGGRSTALRYVRECRHLAEYDVARYKNPTLRIKQFKIRPAKAPSTIWPLVLGLEIGDRVRLERTPQRVGAQIQADLLIEQEVWSMSSDVWEVAYTGSPVDSKLVSSSTHWVLGKSKLGTETRLYP